MRIESRNRIRWARHPLDNQCLIQPGGWLDQKWMAPTLCRWGILMSFAAVIAYCVVGTI